MADPLDREAVALIAACLSYGNVRSILRGIDDVLSRLGGRPRDYLLSHRPAAIRRAMRGFRYRVTDEQTMGRLLLGLRGVLIRYGSLESCAAAAGSPNQATAIPFLSGLAEQIERHAGGPLPHLLAHPARRSACKRLMLFARWMVRCDAVDPGGWSQLKPRQLIVPLDTHMRQVGLAFGWLTRRTADLPAAMQITEALRAFSPDDPLRYDFALTRPGIRKEPWLGETVM